MKGPTEHPPDTVAQFEVDDGCLQIGGVSLPRLAARAGGTPFFAYSRDLITKRVSDLRSTLPDAIAIHYAMKANPMPAVVQHLAGLVDGLDVASAQEMKTALDTPVPADRISFAGPGKSESEIRQAIAAGVLLSIESPKELQRVGKIAESLGLKPRVMVRLNPDFEIKTSGMRMSGGSKVFGIDAEAAPDTLREIGAMGLGFEGFHIFGGSQVLDAQALFDAQKKSVELSALLLKHAPGPVRKLNIGGGFGLPYFPGDRPLDLATVGANLDTVVRDAEKAIPDAQLIVELGRYLVGEAGIYVCRVLDRKMSRNKTFLVTDGGLHHHLAASGNFGQVVRRNYPVAVGCRIGAPSTETVDITGRLCTPIDVLARDARLPTAEVGDFIVIFQSGAYGLTASPTQFLGHPPPVELLV